MTFKSSTLDNGLTVITDASPQYGGLSVRWGLRSGARHEEVHGAAHFLEHMFANSYQVSSGKEVSKRFNEICVGSNFTTWTDAIGAFAETSMDHKLEVISTLGQIVSNPVWDKKTFENQRSRIVDEYRKFQQKGAMVVGRAGIELAYAGHPLAHNILGDLNTIKSMKDQHLHAYREKNFHGQRMGVVVSGNVEHDEIVSLVEASFGTIPKGTTVPKQSELIFKGGQTLVVETQEAAEENVLLSFQGLSVVEPDSTASALMMGLYGTKLDLILSDLGLYSSSSAYSFVSSDFGEREIAVSLTTPENAKTVLMQAYQLAMQPEKWLKEEVFREKRNKEKMYADFVGTVDPRARTSSIEQHYRLSGEIKADEEIKASWNRSVFKDLQRAYEGWNKKEFNVVAHGPLAESEIPTPQELMASVSVPTPKS